MISAATRPLPTSGDDRRDSIVIPFVARLQFSVFHGRAAGRFQ